MTRSVRLGGMYSTYSVCRVTWWWCVVGGQGQTVVSEEKEMLMVYVLVRVGPSQNTGQVSDTAPHHQYFLSHCSDLE